MAVTIPITDNDGTFWQTVSSLRSSKFKCILCFEYIF